MTRKNLLKYLLSLSLLFAIYNSNAQQIKSLTDYRELSNEADEFEKLIFENIPTIYLLDGKKSLKGKSPKRVITDAGSWKNLHELNHPELVKVIIVQFREKTDLNQSLNLDLLERFSSLDKIYISGHFSICKESTTSCELKQIEKILKGSSSVDIIYNFQTIN